ncbi:M20 aminoacylase family protein [Roseibium sp. SCP14]|uniref:M20 aminoacylase family protein n=1 Tax=Roseibium sp. SCP14 TaxID=3141375 RepID=UPI00333A23B5
MLERARELHDKVRQWRRQLHRYPELGFNVHNTADFVSEKLRSFGCDEVVTGIGRTGVVGVIHGQGDSTGSVVGLRADMDALPIHEETGADWASNFPGCMHACGHDGHTAMLLGAARILAEERRFSGKVVLIFQPAEEGAGGGREMVEDGLMERFGVDRVFAMHNMPGISVGHFAIKPGPIMASASRLKLKVTGKGGHGALPHTTKDPIVAICAMVLEMQTIVSRNVDPLEPLVVSVGKIGGGEGISVIPGTAEFAGTVRTLSSDTTDLAERRLTEIIGGLAQAHDVQADLEFMRNYPPTINHLVETELAIETARTVSGDEQVATGIAPLMASEDFAFMLNARPGAMIFIGNGESANLHHPAYDFNDDIIPAGISYWVRLAERVLADLSAA